jgi:pimeloyl-ACP methyl ester carboxylesterase
MAATLATPELMTVGDVTLEIEQHGTGRPILFLHGAGGPKSGAPFLQMLAAHGRVIAPSHPGFGRSPLPDWIESVDDLAYLYLDLLEQLDLRDVAVVGVSMGGWTAAEIAIKNTARIAKLVLVDPVGIKVGDRETRDLPDIYSLSPEQVTRLMWHDPSRAPKTEHMSDAELEALARHRHAAALYLWKPYMHNPQLRRRLRRVGVPTLVLRGESDGLVSEAYARAYADAIPGARFLTIAAAGHSPQTEQPEAFVAEVARFIGD